MVSRNVVLLGPQRLEPTLIDAVEALGIRGEIGVVTAGWEERESEDAELNDHIGGRARNLRLFSRGETVFASDRELYGALQARHDALRRLQELYRMRLSHAVECARELLKRTDEDAVIERERQSAIEAVQALDAHHARNVREVLERFESEFAPVQRASVRPHIRELSAELGNLELLCIAGGHVGILLNRMRMFEVLDLWGDRPIIAWSAGAMVLASRIVLFHDSPPQGPGSAEVFDPGLGAYSGLLALPHASRRLRLNDPARIAMFARRFQPDIGAALDPRTRLDWDGERWRGASGTRYLDRTGSLREFGGL
jgi:hypothetical protein